MEYIVFFKKIEAGEVYNRKHLFYTSPAYKKVASIKLLIKLAAQAIHILYVHGFLS